MKRHDELIAYLSNRIVEIEKNIANNSRVLENIGCRVDDIAFNSTVISLEQFTEELLQIKSFLEDLEG